MMAAAIQGLNFMSPPRSVSVAYAADDSARQLVAGFWPVWPDPSKPMAYAKPGQMSFPGATARPLCRPGAALFASKHRRAWQPPVMQSHLRSVRHPIDLRKGTRLFSVAWPTSCLPDGSRVRLRVVVLLTASAASALALALWLMPTLAC